MKKHDIKEILDSGNIQIYIKKNLSAYKIRLKLVKTLKTDRTPSPTAIKKYIKTYYKLQWDSTSKTWIPYQEDTSTNTTSKKNKIKKDCKTITISHKSEIEEDSINKKEKNSSNTTMYNEPKMEEQHCEKSNPNTLPDESINKAINSKESTPISNINSNKDGYKKNSNFITKNFKDEEINPSEYAEYIAALGNEKFSVSMSSFVISLVEQRICKKYNIKSKSNRSKIIQIALIEYLRLTK